MAIWRGGLSIWGAVGGGVIGASFVLRRRGVSIAAFLDAVVPALLIGQAIGRLGCYFNQELFGLPTSLPWALSIDAAHRPEGYQHYASFHPTFLYELLFDLLLAAALVALERRVSLRAGGLFALYVAGYTFARMFIELLRIDPSPHLFGLRANFFVSAVAFVSATAFFLAWQFTGLRASPVRVAEVPSS